MATSFLVCFTMNSRTIAMRMPFSGLSFTAESGTRTLEYGFSGMIPFGIAEKLSSALNPLIESSTSAASLIVLQWIPARSPGPWYMAPPSCRMPLVGRMRAMSFLDAGPLHDAEVCSQMPQVARLADTETPEPLLVPRGTRAVSYGLHACPPQGAYCRLVSGITSFGLLGPAAEDAPVTLLAAVTA